jgi:copper(I)-binding protein
MSALRSAVIGGALLALGAGTTLADASLSADDAWIPLAPPALKVHVAYMTVVNRGTTDRIIVGADSSDYERVELHRSVLKDGVSSMQAVESVTVPANGSVAFAPTGLHLMLIGPKRPQIIDGRVTIALRLKDGEAVTISAPVRRRDAADTGHSHH